MLKAIVISLVITFGSMFAFSIVSIALNMRNQSQLGLGGLLAYSAVFTPWFWYAAVTIFFLAFRYFMRRPVI